MTGYKGARRRITDMAGIVKIFRRSAVGAMIAALALAIVTALAPAAFATGATQIEAKALTDHECDDSEWHFVINQIDNEAHAPSSISVTWANDAVEVVPLDKFTGGVAHYATTSNLDSTVVSATANIYQGWSGQFNLSHGPCGDTPPPYECPTGTVWTDADGDGKVDEGECNMPPPPPVTDACPGMPGTQLPGTVCTTPPPPVVDVCPNMPGSQPVATVCVIPTPPPTPQPIKDNPMASVKAWCVTPKWGEGWARLNNKKSEVRNSFRIIKSGQDKVVRLKAGKKRTIEMTGLRVGSVLKVKSGGVLLAKTRVTGGCHKAPPAETGARTVANST